ncbi:MAG TPA: hypothetical protein VGV61_11890 [Thermoanaerobaculia bacterium]|jgi:hypothetical protein|nr:hypothetical protein [Thermoanaerobaculia bacterium]
MRSTTKATVPVAALAALLWLLGAGHPRAAAAQGLIAKVTLKAEPLTGLTVVPAAKLPAPSPADAAAAARTLRRDLEKRKDLQRDGVCRGEVFRVAVETQPPVSGQWVSVAIDGYSGDHRYLQLFGDPSTRLIQVVATSGDQSQSKTVKVPVRDCAIEPAILVRSRFNPYHPYTVDFTLDNAAELKETFSGYRWRFDDGAIATTHEPYVSHSYFDRVDGAVPYQTFAVEVTGEARATGFAAGRRVARHYAVTLPNNYYHAKRQGNLQPPAITSGAMESRGLRLVGSYRIRNLEKEPLVFRRALVENLSCDVQAPASPAATTPASVLFQGGKALATTIPVTRLSTSLRATVELRRSLPGLPADAIVVPPRIPGGTGPTRRDLGLLDASSGHGAALPLGGAGGLGAPVPSTGGTGGSGPATPLSGVVVIPAETTHQGFLTLDVTQIPPGVCNVGYHLIGTSQSGRPAYASLYFEVRDNPALRRHVSDAATRTFLLDLNRRGLVRGATVTQEDLYHLERRGKIRRTSRGWEIQ